MKKLFKLKKNIEFMESKKAYEQYELYKQVYSCKTKEADLLKRFKLNTINKLNWQYGTYFIDKLKLTFREEPGIFICESSKFIQFKIFGKTVTII